MKLDNFFADRKSTFSSLQASFRIGKGRAFPLNAGTAGLCKRR
jgi:hypothetical protein